MQKDKVTWNDLPKNLQSELKNVKNNIMNKDKCPYPKILLGGYVNNEERYLKVTKTGLNAVKHNVEKGFVEGFTAGELPLNECRFKYIISNKKILEMCRYLANHFKDYKWGGIWEFRGVFHIPPNGFLGWHTNANASDPRMYIVWVEKENSSFFYHEEKDGSIKTIQEKKGWQVNHFKAPHYHAAHADCNRISFGFRPLDEKTYKQKKEAYLKNKQFWEKLNGKQIR